MDAAALIGSDTFHDGRVTFRPGPVIAVHKWRLWDSSMKSIWQGIEALAVLHSVLDFRRVLMFQDMTG